MPNQPLKICDVLTQILVRLSISTSMNSTAVAMATIQKWILGNLCETYQKYNTINQAISAKLCNGQKGKQADGFFIGNLIFTYVYP